MTLLSKEQFPLQVVGFDALYGLEILSLGEGEATAHVAVRDEVKQPAGLVHGGVYAAIAESVLGSGAVAANDFMKRQVAK